MTAKTLTWDWREQPDLKALAALVAEISGGTVRIREVETGSDQYEIAIERSEPAARQCPPRDLTEHVDRFGNISVEFEIGGGPGTRAGEKRLTGASASPVTIARFLRDLADDVERLAPREGTGCTPACWTPVVCPACGNQLPPRGHSVPLAMNIPDCCDEARMNPETNPRHLWNEEEAGEWLTTTGGRN